MKIQGSLVLDSVLIVLFATALAISISYNIEAGLLPLGLSGIGLILAMSQMAIDI